MTAQPAKHVPIGAPMQHMLAYTIQSTPWANNRPSVIIDVGGKRSVLVPANGQDNSYWIVILDAMDPRKVVKDWVIPGANQAVPAGIDTYLDDPKYIFAVCT
ncbi:MAG TPA: hypothetical protein VGC82_04310, partial [Rhodopila sp.]